MESLLDTVAGLPVHPLVVHLAIVLLPLSVLGVVASIYLPPVSKRYLSLSALGTLLGTGATFLAKQSGEALAERVGLPQRRPKSRINFLGAVATATGLAVLVLSVVTGHTGAEAVWKSRIANASSSASGGASGTITMAEVAKHKLKSDCWSAIDGKVYDLTHWIERHPGGPGVITFICGKDGSSSFNNQHSGQQRPADELRNFYKGDLASG